MDKEQIVSEIKSSVSQIVAIKVEKSVSRAEWGAIDFKGCSDDLRDIISMVKPLGNLPIRIIPVQHLNSIKGQLVGFLEAVREMDEFKLEGEPSVARDAIAKRINSFVQSIYNAISPHAAYLALQAGDLDRTIQTLEDLRISASGDIDVFKENLQNSKTEIDGIMTSAREAAGEAGVGAFATDFSDEAVELSKESTTWLKVTASFGVASVIAAILALFIPIADDATVPQIVQLTTSKVVILGIFLSATFWAARQYRALRHQISINRHRSNALRTFQAFAKAANDEAAKDAVLLETTRSIFAIAPSGYLNQGSEPSSQDGLKIVEMIRGAHSAD